ncbi:MAG: CCA tRNA nucleotidyltransferase [Candidatus Staskawiczbacteria bacterium]|nr:CCA tRNA nucleotidyltransferase [Candidatus Staskawiczbacteria bacterium]
MVIPKEVKNIIDKLEKANFEAFIVGGCVRDILLASPKFKEGGLKSEPKDWDIATNAKPEEIQKVFPESFYENNFLTVTVMTKSKKPELQKIEITTYRLEAKYSDKRHPDEVRFAKTIEDDLARRDFTVNAIAVCIKGVKNEIIDPFSGQEDLKNKIIKTVGNSEERFSEDALRMARAARFATTLGFKIEESTAEAIKKNSIWLKAISQERIRDEFLKIIMADNAADGVEQLRELGLLKYIVPELEEGYGVSQNKHHIYDCYWHSVKALEYAAKKKFNMQVRVASLFHDIAKPRVKAGSGDEATFYNHEVVGAKMTLEILNRLKFSKKDIEKITKLVRYHLFYYNVDEVGESSVRRLIKNVGPENVEELLQVRHADRIGSGVPKAEPYKLRHLKYIIDKVSQDPISVKMLKISGNDIINILKIQPGPKIGQILDILLGYVLDDPKNNKKEILEKEVEKLGKLEDKKLKDLAEKSKKDKTEIEIKTDQMTKKKYWVT